MKHGIVAFLFVAACGGGGGDGGPPDAEEPGGGRDCGCVQLDAPQCGPDGHGAATGSVQGVAIDGVARANHVVTAGVHAIVVDETPGACGEPSTTGEHLVVLFCDAPLPGTYAIVDEASFSCPGNDVAVLLEAGGGTDIAAATGGTVTIYASEACTPGTFEAQFGDETITGGFDAVSCP